MLYVFLVNTGCMLTFDISLAFRSVQELKDEIRSKTGVPPDQQVLLVTGGETLDEPERQVSSYTAGTDTNPFFLFNKIHIESQNAPQADCGPAPLGMDMKLKIEKLMNEAPSYDTLVGRTTLAKECYDIALKEFRVCDTLVLQQHLQHQGWTVVVANLEDYNSSFRKNCDMFNTLYKEYKRLRKTHALIVDGLPGDIELLGKVPLLNALNPNGSSSLSLLDWILAQNPKGSADDLDEIKIIDLDEEQSKVFEQTLEDIPKIAALADKQEKKEIKGLDERLSKLAQILDDVKKVVSETEEIAKGFTQNQSRATQIKDSSVLHDLCQGHRTQLITLCGKHQKLQNLRQTIVKAKQELCDNLQMRLKWLVHVQRVISDTFERTFMFADLLKRFMQKLKIAEQIHNTPSLYATALSEVVRRRTFGEQYGRWTEGVSRSAKDTQDNENKRRDEFASRLKSHFLKKLFPALSKTLPPFACEPPDNVDVDLPKISASDLEQLASSVPDLALVLQTPAGVRSALRASPAFVLQKSDSEDSEAAIFKMDDLHDSGTSKMAAVHSSIQSQVGRLKAELNSMSRDVLYERDTLLALVTNCRSQWSATVASVLEEKEQEVRALQSKLVEMEQAVELERNRTSDAENEVVFYHSQVRALTETLDSTKTEVALHEEEWERRQSELEKKMILSHEVELERLRSHMDVEKMESESEVQAMRESMRRLMNENDKLNAHAQAGRKNDDKDMISRREHEDAMQRMREEAQAQLEKAREEWQAQKRREMERIERENEDKLKQAVIGGQQDTFNEAVKRAMRDKEGIIEDIKQREMVLAAMLERDREILEKLQVVFRPDRTAQVDMDQLSVDLEERLKELRLGDLNRSVAAIAESSHDDIAEFSIRHDMAVPDGAKSLVQSNQVAISTCDEDNLVLLCYHDKYEQYVVFTTLKTLHFLNTECFDELGLNSESGEAKKSWVLAKVTSKEYCQAKKANNRFRVPVGTKFYRVKAKPWNQNQS